MNADAVRAFPFRRRNFRNEVPPLRVFVLCAIEIEKIMLPLLFALLIFTEET